MKKVVAAALCTLLLLVGSNVFAAGKDIPGSKDHPLLTRMPDFFISGYEDKEYDKYDFSVQDGKKVSRIPVEGHKYYFQYNLNKDVKQPGELKVVRNIQAALTKIGGKVLYEGERPWNATIKLEKSGKETWVTVSAWPTLYRLTIIEKEVMKQEVEANAEAMGNDIQSTGHVAIYGIYFDTGKAEIKPESDLAIAEIAKLFKNDSA